MIRSSAAHILRRFTLHSALALGLAAGGFSYAAEQKTVRLYTENFPPYNMADSTENYAHKPEDINGFSTEIVKTLFARLNIPYTMKLRSWTRSLGLARAKPGYGVFSTTRTPQREADFKWVGPIAQNNWTIFAKSSQKLKIASVDDMKSYRVGGYTGDSVTVYLQDNGVQVSDIERDELNAKRLDNDQIDLWATGNISGLYHAKAQKVGGLEPVFTVKQTDLYIAFNKDTDQALIDRLNNELKKMRGDGVIDRIIADYSE